MFDTLNSIWSRIFRTPGREKKERLQKTETKKRLASARILQYQDFALNRISSGVEANDPIPIVISLTTFGRRIDDVFLAIESLFQQSHKADKVVLWLLESDFSPADLPAILKKQCKRGLEIEFYKKDLGPYAKFYYSLKKYPGSLVLTVDDDVIYPIDMVDQLYRAYIQQPDIIHCHRAHKILFSDEGNILPYKQWSRIARDTQQPSRLVFPTGVGGVLYFPGCFDDEVLNQDAFMKLSPYADDIWLKAMSLKKGTMCRKVDDDRDWWWRISVLEGSQKITLKQKNRRGVAGNDDQLKAVFNAYDLWPLLRIKD